MKMCWKHASINCCYGKSLKKESVLLPITAYSLCASSIHSCFAVLCIISPVFMVYKHKWYVKSCETKETLCYIGSGEDIDMAFWWHYEASLISPYCVVTASNHTSSLAWGAALNGLIELMYQIYEGWFSVEIKEHPWHLIHEYNPKCLSRW